MKPGTAPDCAQIEGHVSSRRVERYTLSRFGLHIFVHGANLVQPVVRGLKSSAERNVGSAKATFAETEFAGDCRAYPRVIKREHWVTLAN